MVLGSKKAVVNPKAPPVPKPTPAVEEMPEVEEAEEEGEDVEEQAHQEAMDTDSLPENLVQILQNHETRLQAIEAALFRIRGSI